LHSCEILGAGGAAGLEVKRLERGPNLSSEQSRKEIGRL
jgi:hypothetical protein